MEVYIEDLLVKSKELDNPIEDPQETFLRDQGDNGHEGPQESKQSTKVYE